jgi:hypothetical protein
MGLCRQRSHLDTYQDHGAECRLLVTG